MAGMNRGPRHPKAIEEGLSLLPTGPGVYLMHDAEGAVLYVGKAVNLRNRVRSYFREDGGHTAMTRRMIPRIARFDWISTENELEALVLESVLIKRYQPPNNIRLKDDRGYPYLLVTDEEYPRILLVRERGKGGRYFGPFPEIGSLYATLELLSQLYRLRTCKTPNRERPCLNYHIKRCSGPCHGKIPPEEYRALVEEVCSILGGKGGIEATVERLMREAAERLEFERAARLRDVRKGLDQFAQKQKVVGDPSVDEDIIAVVVHEPLVCIQLFQVRSGKLIQSRAFDFDAEGASPASVLEAFLGQYYSRAVEIPPSVSIPMELEGEEVLAQYLTLRRGGKVRLHHPKGAGSDLLRMAERNARESLERSRLARAQDEGALAGLAELCEVSRLGRIECYDISTIQGSDTVASMVVFEEGKPAKAEYRRFRIKREGLNDFAAMQEVLRRRFGKDWPKPDLVIVDGGKGQLSAACEVLDELGVEVAIAGLAKRFEELFLPGQPARRPEGAALYLLQRIRDEAHRFAVTYHRLIRGKRMTRSMLDEIEGIGPARRRKLLQAFGSVEGMRHASVEELARAGLPAEVAKRLLEHLRGD